MVIKYEEFIKKLTEEVREISKRTFIDHNILVLGNPQYNEEEIQDFFEYIPCLNAYKKSEVYYDGYRYSGNIEVNPILGKANDVYDAWYKLKKDIYNSIDQKVESVCADIDGTIDENKLDIYVERVGIEREVFM